MLSLIVVNVFRQRASAVSPLFQALLICSQRLTHPVRQEGEDGDDGQRNEVEEGVHGVSPDVRYAALVGGRVGNVPAWGPRAVSRDAQNCGAGCADAQNVTSEQA